MPRYLAKSPILRDISFFSIVENAKLHIENYNNWRANHHNVLDNKLLVKYINLFALLIKLYFYKQQHCCLGEEDIRTEVW